MWFHDHNCSFIFCLLHHGLCKKGSIKSCKKSYTKTSCSSGWQRSSFRLVPTTTATTRATTWRLSTAMAWSTAETVERMRRTTTKNPSSKFGNAGWASMLHATYGCDKYKFATLEKFNSSRQYGTVFKWQHCKGFMALNIAKNYRQEYVGYWTTLHSLTTTTL